MKPRRRINNKAKLEFASTPGLDRSNVQGRLPTSFCDPLGSLRTSPMGQTVAEDQTVAAAQTVAEDQLVAVAQTIVAAMKNGMGHSSPVVAAHPVVAAQHVVAAQSVVADQIAVVAKQLFGTLESERKPSKMELQEHHQDPPRRSINIRPHRNTSKVTVPVTLTFNLQLCRTRVPARRFALRRAKPKVPATHVSAPPWNLSGSEKADLNLLESKEKVAMCQTPVRVRQDPPTV